jgi:hypothetical protein
MLIASTAFSFGNLFAGMLFSAIGFGAFIYGKKQGLWRTMLLGLSLCVYPYFIENTLVIYLTGIILTCALFFYRE